MDKCVIKPVTQAEIGDAHQLQQEGYPADETASLETLSFRLSKAPNLFQGYFVEDRLMGFVCGTRYNGERMEEESMSEHKEQGENICIQSVCVAPKYRRQGVASSLLRHYIDKVVPQETGVSRVLLICKHHLMPLYTKAGFSLVSKSHIVHGADPWYEMKITLTR